VLLKFLLYLVAKLNAFLGTQVAKKSPFVPDLTQVGLVRRWAVGGIHRECSVRICYGLLQAVQRGLHVGSEISRVDLITVFKVDGGRIGKLGERRNRTGPQAKVN